MQPKSSERRTIKKALEKFDLIAGVGDGKTTACVMTALSWKAGRAWTDHPECAHRLIADFAISANDASETTVAQRKKLLVLGEEGILDTWWVPDVVFAWVLSSIAGEKSRYAQVAQLLRRIAQWKKTKSLRPNLRGADLWGANLWGANLRGANHHALSSGWTKQSSGLVTRGK